MFCFACVSVRECAWRGVRVRKWVEAAAYEVLRWLCSLCCQDNPRGITHVLNVSDMLVLFPGQRDGLVIEWVRNPGGA